MQEQNFFLNFFCFSPLLLDTNILKSASEVIELLVVKQSLAQGGSRIQDKPRNTA